MAEARPDPNELLERVKAEEARAHRGRLRIFFGASAGVGKTYAMLEATRSLRLSGIDVVVGYVEPHGRIETEQLLEGLSLLAPLIVRYRGIERHEFDLDAALARHPEILLVDELAHSNLIGGEPPPRHPKRWQDIEELLTAGISVWTTLNVQHLESLNDLVFQTTGVRQRETLPDHVFEEADDIELIDLPPDDLIARLHDGKIYVADQAAAATERFFRKQNLMALREIALRRVADRVEAASRALPADRAQVRLARDRVLVAVGPGEQASELVRAGKRMADALDAEWTVVYVETPALLKLSEGARNRRIDVLRLAESLGAETVTLSGPSAAATIAEYAQLRRATRVLVGAPHPRGWRVWVRPSTSIKLAQRARGFDLVMIASGSRGMEPPAPAGLTVNTRPPVRWERYVRAAAISTLCTLLASVMYGHFELSNLVMIYLLGVTVAGLRLGRGPSAFTAVLNVIALDFFFVPPRYSFAVSDAQYLVTFFTMVTIALVIATLTASVRQQTRVAGARERRTALLYAMSRELGSTRGTANMARVAVRHVAEVFRCQAVVLLPDAKGKLSYPREPPLESSFRGADLAVAQWVADHGRLAGLGTDTLPAASGLYLPLGDSTGTSGVLGVYPGNPRRVLLPEQNHLLSTFAGQIALALERARLAETAEQASVAAEREMLRNTVLASISHDLRTPLAVMAAAGSTLAQHGTALDESTRIELAHSVESKAREMSELVSNVLDLVRLESGKLALRRDWQTVDDLVGSSLRAYRDKLGTRPTEVRLPAELPPIWVDATLIVQVFNNLLDNVVKYTPEGTRVTITAVADDEHGRVNIMVDDDGSGLPAGDPARLFDKFQRGQEEGNVIGVGLGLAICQAIVRAHGGQIEAQHRECGGARFVFTLPTVQGSPS